MIIFQSHGACRRTWQGSARVPLTCTPTAEFFHSYGVLIRMTWKFRENMLADEYPSIFNRHWRQLFKVWKLSDHRKDIFIVPLPDSNLEQHFWGSLEHLFFCFVRLCDHLWCGGEGTALALSPFPRGPQASHIW